MSTLCSMFLTLLKTVVSKGFHLKSGRTALFFSLFSQPVNRPTKEVHFFPLQKWLIKLHFAGWTKITEQITVNFLHCSPSNHLRKSW